MINFLWFIILGAVAGWIAGLIMKGKGFGIIGNIIVGILGAVVGGWLFRFFNTVMTNTTLGSLLTAVIGAVVLLFIIGLFKK